MNKILLLFPLTLFTTTIFAQIKFAPEAGIYMGMQTEKTTIPPNNITHIASAKLALGAMAGLNLDIKVLRNMYIHTGAFYVFNNIKYASEVADTTELPGKPRLIRYDRTHNIRIPLFIMYKSGFDGMGRFIAGVGPYASYTISGSRLLKVPYPIYDSSTKTVSYIVEESNTNIKLGNDKSRDQLLRWDYGLNACIGYESNVGIYFRGAFSHSLVNLAPGNPGDFRVRNWGFGVSIGYLIGKDNW